MQDWATRRTARRAVEFPQSGPEDALRQRPANENMEGRGHACNEWRDGMTTTRDEGSVKRGTRNPPTPKASSSTWDEGRGRLRYYNEGRESFSQITLDEERGKNEKRGTDGDGDLVPRRCLVRGWFATQGVLQCLTTAARRARGRPILSSGVLPWSLVRCDTRKAPWFLVLAAGPSTSHVPR
jgi:hypothetical protein